MRRGLMLAALGAGAYWASKQPGGIPATLRRLQQGARDIAAGQDPRAVCDRFMHGRDEEPAGLYTDEVAASKASVNAYQEPYRDYVSG